MKKPIPVVEVEPNYEMQDNHAANGWCNEVKAVDMESSTAKSYLGHFAQKKYLREGYNVSERPMGIFDPFKPQAKKDPSEPTQYMPDQSEDSNPLGISPKLASNISARAVMNSRAQDAQNQADEAAVKGVAARQSAKMAAMKRR